MNMLKTLVGGGKTSVIAAVLAVIAMGAQSAFGETWEWTQSATGTAQDYKTDANWKSGTAPTNYGGTYLNTTDTFIFTNEVDALQSISFGDDNSYWYGLQLGSVLMDRFHQFKLTKANHVYIQDASQMEGYIRLPGGQSDNCTFGGPLVKCADGKTNRLPQTLIQNGAWLMRHGDSSEGNLGGVAEFGKLFGLGLFKIGDENAGMYQTYSTTSYLFDFFQTGVQGHLMADGGGARATVQGHATDAAIASGAYLHLDASAAGTVDADFVWHDADGGTVTATPVGTPVWGTSTNNLATLRLGAGTAYELSENISGVQEIFLVFRDFDTCYWRTLPPLVGDWEGVGNFARSGQLPYGYLFATGTASTKWMDAGEVWCDGTRVVPDHCIAHTGAGQLHVVSVMLYGGTGLVGCLGETMKNAAGSGGQVEFAEVLVYQRTLTDAERRATNKYLRQKWQSAELAYDWDLGTYWVRNNAYGTDTINFEAGTTSVRELKFQSDQSSFVKYGSGRLETSRISPENLPITVNAGSLAIVRPEGAVKCEMAADPVVWLDPSDATTLTFDSGSDSRVNDVIDVRKKENKTGNVPHAHTVQNWNVDGASPLLVTDTPTGRAALDFGDAATSAETFEGKSSCMEVSGYPFGNEAFIVWKKNADSCGQPIGNGGWDFFGCDATKILDREHCLASAVSGYWTVNGEIIACWDVSLPTNEYMVIALRVPEGFGFSKLGSQRSYADVNGACSYGEYILYDRILSPEERRNTEAYLMKKWLNKDHPMAKAMTVPTYTIAADAENTIETDVDMTIGTLTTANAGAFTKKGSGRLVTDLPDGTTSIAVEGGTLAATDDNTSVFADADFHFDASDDSCFVYESGSATKIERWNDTRLAAGGSTISARLQTEWSTNAPSRVEVEINGATRTVVDFGEYCKAVPADGNMCTNTGSRLRLYSGDEETMFYSGREFYIVRRDTEDDTSKRTEIFTACANCLERNGAEAFNYMIFPAQNTGYTYTVDGANCDYNVSIDTGWHVHCLTMPNNTYWVRHVGGDSMQGGENYFGGIQIAEVVSFATPRSAAERQQIINYLRKKWMGESEGVTKTYDSVSVAKGASLELDLSGWSGVAVTQFSGGGTVDFGVPLDLSAQDAFTFNFESETDYGRLDFTDALTIKDDAVININVDMAKLPSGTYPLITAPSITGTPASAPVVTAAKNYSMRIVKRNATIVLEVKPSGFVIIAR